MGGLDRDHYNNNMLDQVAELQRRLDRIERSALMGIIGPYEPDATTTITGYLNLQIAENGEKVPYRLAIADIYATNPVDVSGNTPIGGIIGWSGSVNNIPAHWALCNGASGTPDLRDRFILGAGPTYTAGTTGGAATVDASHDHGVGTLDAAAAAAHAHGDGTLAADSDAHSHGDGTLAISNDTHSHLVSGNTGSAGGSEAGATIMNGVNLKVDAHAHAVSIVSGEYTHNHGISGSTASDSHSHGVSGSTATGGGHDHALSGSVATGGSATEANMPPYYVLYWIMRIS